MNRAGAAAAAVLFLAATTHPVFASDPGSLTAGMATFAEKALPSLPLAASAGLDWSNAYIGPLFGGDFPYLHGGVGVEVGLTTIPGEAVDALLNASGASEGGAFPLPFAVASLRLGGIQMPFDFGLKAGFLPDALAEKTSDGYAFKYKNFGLDVRYSLMKGTFWLPDISAGGGIHYLEFGISKGVGDAFHYVDGAHTLDVYNPRLNLELNTTVVEAKAQISKTFLFFVTPYAGVSALLGAGSALSGIEASGITASGNDVAYWNQYGFYPNANGFQSEKQSATFGLKVYGGFSLNVLILKLDLQGMANLTDGSGGAQVGARLQL